VYQFGSIGTLTIESNLLVGNDSPMGAGLAIESSAGTRIRRNTIVGSRRGEGIFLEGNSLLVMEQNIVALGESQGVRVVGNAEVHCNDSFGNGGGDYLPAVPADNISADPMFCGPELGDYTLRDGSPCLAAGNGCALPIGAFDRGCAASAIESASWSRIKASYRKGR
jgi:hypothetical protein